MKKGFTLIELLAVIVILAIIALIATPIVLNIVNDARENTNTRTAEGVIASAKYYGATGLLDNDVSVSLDGMTNVLNNLDMDNKPTNGVVTVNEDSDIFMSVLIGDKCYQKQFNSNEITTVPVTNNCVVDIPYNISIISNVKDSVINDTDFELVSVNSIVESNSNLEYYFDASDEINGVMTTQGILDINNDVPIPLISNSNPKVSFLNNQKNIKAKQITCADYADNLYIKIKNNNPNKDIKITYNIMLRGEEASFLHASVIYSSSFNGIPEYTTHIYNYDRLSNGYNANVSIDYTTGTEEYIYLKIYYSDVGTCGSGILAPSVLIRNLKVSSGGLNGESEVYMPTGTNKSNYHDLGLLTRSGKIINAKTSEITNNLPATSANGLYTYVYNINTINGMQTITRNVNVGYERAVEIGPYYIKLNHLFEGTRFEANQFGSYHDYSARVGEEIPVCSPRTANYRFVDNVTGETLYTGTFTTTEYDGRC